MRYSFYISGYTPENPPDILELTFTPEGRDALIKRLESLRSQDGCEVHRFTIFINGDGRIVDETQTVKLEPLNENDLKKIQDGAKDILNVTFTEMSGEPNHNDPCPPGTMTL